MELGQLPRMADFVQWVEACGPTLGWVRGCFAEAYQSLRSDTDGRALDLWEVMPCLRGLLVQEPLFEGTSAQLLKKLNGMADVLEVPRYRSSEWPTTAKALATQLRRYAPNLRRSGIRVVWLPRTRDGYPVRITLHAAEQQGQEVNVAAS